MIPGTSAVVVSKRGREGLHQRGRRPASTSSTASSMSSAGTRWEHSLETSARIPARIVAPGEVAAVAVIEPGRLEQPGRLRRRRSGIGCSRPGSSRSSMWISRLAVARKSPAVALPNSSSQCQGSTCSNTPKATPRAHETRRLWLIHQEVTRHLMRGENLPVEGIESGVSRGPLSASALQKLAASGSPTMVIGSGPRRCLSDSCSARTAPDGGGTGWCVRGCNWVVQGRISTCRGDSGGRLRTVN